MPYNIHVNVCQGKASVRLRRCGLKGLSLFMEILAL